MKLIAIQGRALSALIAGFAFTFTLGINSPANSAPKGSTLKWVQELTRLPTPEERVKAFKARYPFDSSALKDVTWGGVDYHIPTLKIDMASGNLFIELNDASREMKFLRFVSTPRVRGYYGPMREVRRNEFERTLADLSIVVQPATVDGGPGVRVSLGLTDGFDITEPAAEAQFPTPAPITFANIRSTGLDQSHVDVAYPNPDGSGNFAGYSVHLQHYTSYPLQQTHIFARGKVQGSEVAIPGKVFGLKN